MSAACAAGVGVAPKGSRCGGASLGHTVRESIDREADSQLSWKDAADHPEPTRVADQGW